MSRGETRLRAVRLRTRERKEECIATGVRSGEQVLLCVCDSTSYGDVLSPVNLVGLRDGVAFMF